jgi:succinoglycan biosynthesis protein ExoV
MKLCWYRGRSPNFGDDLNEFLFPRLLPGVFNDEPAEPFLGIGSILFDRHPREAWKIVFGSGYAGYTAPPVLDDSWRVHFVRGPRTAAHLGLDAALGVGDSAMLISNLGLVRAPVRGRIAYMPHVDSACDGAWQAAAAEAGVHYLDPRRPVEETLAGLLSAEKVVTEAMHGAIVSDALRIPWVAMRPLFKVHRPKWQDWAESLDLTLRPIALPSSNLMEILLAAADGRRATQRRIRWHLRDQTALGASACRSSVVKVLRLATAAEPQLSGDSALRGAVERMLEALDRVRRAA